MEKIKKALSIYGLDEKEIIIYLHLLSREASTSYKIAKELDLPQSTVHGKLESLLKKRIISAWNSNNIKYYAAENLKSFRENLVQKLEEINSIIPDLQSIAEKKDVETPKVRFYTDKKGARLIWEEMLDVYKDEIINPPYATTHKSLWDLFPRFFEKWVQRRRKIGVGVKLMCPQSEKDFHRWDIQQENEQVRFIDDQYLSNNEITTYGNKTAIFIFDKKRPQTIVIESREVTKVFRKLLKFMWDHSD